MYRSGYSEVVADGGQAGRRQERAAFQRVIRLLTVARDDPGNARALIEARSFTVRLWTVLMDELAAPGNGLPEELRAGLLSIGIWVMRETDEAHTPVPDLDALIETHQIVLDGLE